MEHWSGQRFGVGGRKAERIVEKSVQEMWLEGRKYQTLLMKAPGAVAHRECAVRAGSVFVFVRTSDGSIVGFVPRGEDETSLKPQAGSKPKRRFPSGD